MTVEFACDRCKQVLSYDGEPDSVIECPNCHGQVTVPQAEAGQHEAITETFAQAMPWTISVLLHLGVALIIAFVPMFAEQMLGDEPPIIPEGTDSPEVGKAMQASLSVARRPERQVTTLVRRHTKQAGLSKNPSKQQALVIGHGAKGPFGGLNAPIGRPDGGSGPFGIDSLGSKPYHVVYVIDRSGSMLGKMKSLKEELARSISGLRDYHTFHVILFNNGPHLEFDSRRLTAATGENKVKAAKFLATVVEGNDIEGTPGTDPSSALRRAFEALRAMKKQGGKLIYLLTDGDFRDNEGVLKVIRAYNASREVRITTFLYEHKDRKGRGKAVLEQIAAENRGNFHYINPYE